MFDHIIRELRALEQTPVAIPLQLPLDNDGYFDRCCPSDACLADFKVLWEDWETKIKDEQAFCPICREEAKGTEWNTPEQVEYISNVAIRHVQGIIDQALSQDARAFNRRQGSGFITMSLSHKPGTPMVIVPINAAEELRQKFTCEECGCRYSSLGAAFFCPVCGHNSAESTFTQTIETVRKSMAALPAIQEAVKATADADAAMNTARQILETNMVRVVGALQRLAESLFERIPAAATIKRRKNVFQSLTEGSVLWRTATGKGYEDLISPVELSDLLRLFQQRHLLAHREGIVDQEYLGKSGDATYAVGQRLVIRDEGVGRLAEISTKLADELRQLV